MTQPTLKDRAKEIEKTLQCNCDLDRWEPEPDTGHSWVCRIHTTAKIQANTASHRTKRGEEL